MGARKDFVRMLNNPVGVRFGTLLRVVEAFGLELHRTEGSHRIYKHPAVPGLLNLQERKGEAKSYQVRQFLKIVEKYGLRLPGEE